MSETALIRGHVKWFDVAKGYGFLRPDDGRPDVFVHLSALKKSGVRELVNGQLVLFRIEMSRGRLAAADIQITE